MQHCTHNNGHHVWYLTGKKRQRYIDDLPLVATCNIKPDLKSFDKIDEYEQVFHNCGETKWD